MEIVNAGPKAASKGIDCICLYSRRLSFGVGLPNSPPQSSLLYFIPDRVCCCNVLF